MKIRAIETYLSDYKKSCPMNFECRLTFITNSRRSLLCFVTLQFQIPKYYDLMNMYGLLFSIFSKVIVVQFPNIKLYKFFDLYNKIPVKPKHIPNIYLLFNTNILDWKINSTCAVAIPLHKPMLDRQVYRAYFNNFFCKKQGKYHSNSQYVVARWALALPDDIVLFCIFPN